MADWIILELTVSLSVLTLTPHSCALRRYSPKVDNLCPRILLLGRIQTKSYGPCSQLSSVQFSSVQSLSRVRLFVTPWTATRQASLSITNSQTLLKLMSIESVMPSNHLILCHLLLPLPSIFPSIRVFSNESVLCIRWPNYWEFQLHHQSFQWETD